MCFHSIINEDEVFLSQESQPQILEKNTSDGVMRFHIYNGKQTPVSFFSTDPFSYLKKENQITNFYN